MKDYEIVGQICWQMGKFKPAEKAKYYIVFHKGKFYIWDDRPMNENITIVATLTKMDINKGLTSEKWLEIETAVHNFNT